VSVAQRSPEDRSDDAARFEEYLGVLLNHDLLERALTHRSYAYENGGLPTNERLEFLGDAVLGLVVTDQRAAGVPRRRGARPDRHRRALLRAP
jgi:ribonuclease-3